MEVEQSKRCNHYETNVILWREKKIKKLNAMIQRTVLSEAETQYIAVW